MPPINFRNAADSTVDNGNMSSITYSEGRFRSLVDGTPVPTKVHCFFGQLVLLGSESSGFFRFPLAFDRGTSFSTKTVCLWTDSR